MLGGDIFGLDTPQPDCPSQDNELITWGIISFQKLVDFDTNFIADEWVKLSQMQIVLYDLH